MASSRLVNAFYSHGPKTVEKRSCCNLTQQDQIFSMSAAEKMAGRGNRAQKIKLRMLLGSEIKNLNMRLLRYC